MNESHVGIKGRPVGLMTKSPSNGRTRAQSNETREEEMKEASSSEEGTTQSVTDVLVNLSGGDRKLKSKLFVLLNHRLMK